MNLSAGPSDITSSLRIFLLPAMPLPPWPALPLTQSQETWFQETEKGIPLEDRNRKVGEKGNIMWKKFLLYRKKEKKEKVALSPPGKQASHLDLMWEAKKHYSILPRIQDWIFLGPLGRMVRRWKQCSIWGGPWIQRGQESWAPERPQV